MGRIYADSDDCQAAVEHWQDGFCEALALGPSTVALCRSLELASRLVWLIRPK